MRARASRARLILIAAGTFFLLITVSPVQLAGGGSNFRVRVAYNSATGKASFIGTRSGMPVDRPDGLSSSTAPAIVARAFLGSYGKAFGISDQARELQATSTRKAPAGRSVVRFQQVDQGVPVLGGELVVNLDADKNLLSIGGEALPALDISVKPQVESAAARETALTAVAKARSMPASKLRASEPSLWIYDSRILGGPGLGRSTLVWRMDVTDTAEPETIDEFVLVDAQLGMVALQFDQLETAKDRKVCDANNDEAKVPCTAPFARVEGDAASSIPDVNDVYDYSGATYDFYYNYLGRDSIDGLGMTLKSTTRYCPDPTDPDYCPYPNAYWDGEQMVYGEGFASADDVVGHELTHGVTEYTSKLFYYYQSGAINESLSDVFGEFVDQTDGLGNDATSVKWELGEDLPSSIGVIRDMEDPTLFDNPDKMSSSYYSALDESDDYWDNGGVHTNSGINNKAAFLITDGGTFNGYTVTGLGIHKAATIYYEVNTNLLTSASDYGDLYNALKQACTDLIGTDTDPGAGSAVITSGDCTQVTNAVNAVEMNGTSAAAPNPEAPVCSAGQSPHDLFYDNLENSAIGNWTTQLVSTDPAALDAWYYPQNPNDPGFDATYATSGTTNFWGYDQEHTADYRIAMTKNVAIPAGSNPYLRFNHAYMFEDGGVGYYYDGGLLEYSTNNGTSWTDAGSLITNNGYNGTISSGGDNPLKGRSAFVKESNGYISSRASLSSLVGQSVRFRFRIGTDFTGSDYGWFVDDIRVYTCSVDPTFAFSSATYSVGEAGPTASVTINRTGSTIGTDSIQFTTADGTATAGSDYTDETQTVSFAAGETSKAIAIPITDDSLVEDDETVSLSLSSSSTGAVLGDPHAATLTIADNDVALLAFSQPSYSVGEAGPEASIAITRSRNTSSAPSVQVATADGTATAGSDYTAHSETVSFATGETSKTVTIPITEDSLIEGNETVSLSLSSPSAEARLGSPSTATLTIADNDRAFAFSSATYSVGEAGTVSVTISRSGSTVDTDSVGFATADGSATAGSDYTNASQTVSFAPGETSKTVSVPITDDAAYEGNETVSLSLSSPSAGATLADPHAATLTIVDNDVATLTFSQSSYSVGEAGPAASITVNRSGAAASAFSVLFATANGSASAGSDYTAVSQTVSFAAGETSKTVSIPITDDKLVEGNETILLSLSGPSAGAVLGSPHAATLTVTENDELGRIASAKLSKTSFKRALARKVKLTVQFSPQSKKFNYVLTFKKNGNWQKVRTVKKTGTFTGKRTMTVKSLFAGKAVKSGRYRVKLSADANSRTLSFKVL